MIPPRNVAILIFDEVEVLDFCGPFEVFSVAGRGDDFNPFTKLLGEEQALKTAQYMEYDWKPQS